MAVFFYKCIYSLITASVMVIFGRKLLEGQKSKKSFWIIFFSIQFIDTFLVKQYLMGTKEEQFIWDTILGLSHLFNYYLGASGNVFRNLILVSIYQNIGAIPGFFVMWAKTEVLGIKKAYIEMDSIHDYPILLICSLAVILLLPMNFFVLKITEKKIRKIPDFIFATIFVIITIFNIVMAYIQRDVLYKEIPRLISLVELIFSTCSAYAIAILIILIGKKRKERKVIEKKMKMEFVYYQIIEGIQEQIRKFQHDLKNHFIIIESKTLEEKEREVYQKEITNRLMQMKKLMNNTTFFNLYFLKKKAEWEAKGFQTTLNIDEHSITTKERYKLLLQISCILDLLEAVLFWQSKKNGEIRILLKKEKENWQIEVNYESPQKIAYIGESLKQKIAYQMAKEWLEEDQGSIKIRKEKQRWSGKTRIGYRV